MLVEASQFIKVTVITYILLITPMTKIASTLRSKLIPPVSSIFTQGINKCTHLTHLTVGSFQKRIQGNKQKLINKSKIFSPSRK
mgnify:CR=1 FL=1